MPSKNQLPSGPSFMLAARDDEAILSPELATRRGSSDGSSRKPRLHLEVVARATADARPAIRGPAVKSRLRRQRVRKLLATIKVIAGFVARARIELAGALLAAASWVIAQVLAGCAEYCEAMYPVFPEPRQPSDRGIADPPPDRPSGACQIMTLSRRVDFHAAGVVIGAEAVPAQAARLRGGRRQGSPRPAERLASAGDPDE